MKRRLAIVGFVVITMFFTNVCPAKAQLQEMVGLLQWASLLLPSEKAKVESRKMTGEELIKAMESKDLLAGDNIEKDSITTAAKAGEKMNFGNSAKNIIIGGYWIAWYDQAVVNGAAGVMVVFCTIPDPMKNYFSYGFGQLIFELSDKDDQEMLSNFKTNPDERDAFLKEWAQKFSKILPKT
jgi:hypothetical protein